MSVFFTYVHDDFLMYICYRQAAARYLNINIREEIE